MNKMFTIGLLSLFVFCSACGDKDDPGIVKPKPEKEVKWEFSPATLSFGSKGETKNIIVSADGDWKVSSSQPWCTLSSVVGHNGQTGLKITVNANPAETQRTAELTFATPKETYSKKYTISQEAAKEENYVPSGYSMIWQDEFNTARQSNGKPAMPDTEKWWYETGASGWGNNEIQNYVAGLSGTDTCAVVSDGLLKIIAKKRGSEVISIRMNTQQSWQYGYFEARLKVPRGKGTWPAFWMLPKNFQNWPLDGEIDIMEYVGYNPNVVHSSVHTGAYNHVQGTQKTATKSISNAETEFHVYAVEWTADYIKGFVDGVEYFRFNNDRQNKKETWPFDAPFYLKLNLAWGGNWGGAQGVDESALPAVYEIDYVRVYQK